MKVVAIAFKEVLIILRDQTTRLLLLAAPLALTVMMTFVFSQVPPRQGSGMGQIQVTAPSLSTSDRFNYLARYAPSLATLFLMFAMMSVARPLLAEREAGTFDRLRASPVSAAELLGGKILGVFSIALLEMVALLAFQACAQLFTMT